MFAKRVEDGFSSRGRVPSSMITYMFSVTVWSDDQEEQELCSPFPKRAWSSSFVKEACFAAASSLTNSCIDKSEAIESQLMARKTIIANLLAGPS